MASRGIALRWITQGWALRIAALVLTNVLLLSWILSGGAEGQKLAPSLSVRQEWVDVLTPWERQPVPPVLKTQSDTNESPVATNIDPKVATAPVEGAPLASESGSKIDLEQSRAQLQQAIETASANVPAAVTLSCRLWGPMIATDASKAVDLLKGLAGQAKRIEKQVPIGYVVYLPREVVDKGVTIQQLANKGVSDMFYITNPGPLQGTISLGLFRDIERANQQKELLLTRGIDGVEIRERPGPSRVFFEIKAEQRELERFQQILPQNIRAPLGACS